MFEPVDVPVWVIKYANTQKFVIRTMGHEIGNGRVNVVWRGSLSGRVLAEPGQFTMTEEAAKRLTGVRVVRIMNHDLTRPEFWIEAPEFLPALPPAPKVKTVEAELH